MSPTDKTEPKILSDFWKDRVQDRLRRYSIDLDVSMVAIIAAAVANDVSYTDFGRWPYDVSVGLRIGEMANPC